MKTRIDFYANKYWVTIEEMINGGLNQVSGTFETEEQVEEALPALLTTFKNGMKARQRLTDLANGVN